MTKKLFCRKLETAILLEMAGVRVDCYLKDDNEQTTNLPLRCKGITMNNFLEITRVSNDICYLANVLTPINGVNLFGPVAGKFARKEIFPKIAKQAGVSDFLPPNKKFPKIAISNEGMSGEGFLILNSQLEKSRLNSNDYRITSFIQGAIPSNVGALALPWGTYISCPGSTKPCINGTGIGNFWGNLSNMIVEQQYEITKKIGDFLSNSGFFGVFGLDFLITDEKLYLIELNPRPQGPDLARGLALINAGLETLELMQYRFYKGDKKKSFISSKNFNQETRRIVPRPYFKTKLPKKIELAQLPHKDTALWIKDKNILRTFLH